jgi:hypothetical protein
MVGPFILAWLLGILLAKMCFGVLALMRALLKLLFRVPIVGITVTLVVLFFALPYTTAKNLHPDLHAYYAHRPAHIGLRV